jgi:hypothetical protein
VQCREVRSQIQNELKKKLIENEKKEQVKLYIVISNNKTHANANQRIQDRKHEFYAQNVPKMLWQQVIVACNIAIVVIGYAQIEQNIQC